MTGVFSVFSLLLSAPGVPSSLALCRCHYEPLHSGSSLHYRRLLANHRRHNHPILSPETPRPINLPFRLSHIAPLARVWLLTSTPWWVSKKAQETYSHQSMAIPLVFLTPAGLATALFSTWLPLPATCFNSLLFFSDANH